MSAHLSSPGLAAIHDGACAGQFDHPLPEAKRKTGVPPRTLATMADALDFGLMSVFAGDVSSTRSSIRYVHQDLRKLEYKPGALPRRRCVTDKQGRALFTVRPSERPPAEAGAPLRSGALRPPNGPDRAPEASVDPDKLDPAVIDPDPRCPPESTQRRTGHNLMWQEGTEAQRILATPGSKSSV